MRSSPRIRECDVREKWLGALRKRAAEHIRLSLQSKFRVLCLCNLAESPEFESESETLLSPFSVKKVRSKATLKVGIVIVFHEEE